MKLVVTVVVFFAAVSVAMIPWRVCLAEIKPSVGKKSKNVVWLVVFSSRECPKCEGVKDLLEEVKAKYPVRVKAFDVENEKDYALFRTLQGIHSTGDFSVPLIMVGDAVLIGEAEITAKLDETIRGLVRAGGSGLPYLGPTRSTAGPTRSKECNCDRPGAARPPSASSEWKRIRSLLDYFF